MILELLNLRVCKRSVMCVKNSTNPPSGRLQNKPLLGGTHDDPYGSLDLSVQSLRVLLNLQTKHSFTENRVFAARMS